MKKSMKKNLFVVLISALLNPYKAGAVQEILVVACGTQKERPFSETIYDPQEFAHKVASSKKLLAKYTCHQVTRYHQEINNGQQEYIFDKYYTSTLAFLIDIFMDKKLSTQEHANLGNGCMDTPSLVENGYLHARNHLLAAVSKKSKGEKYEKLILKAHKNLAALYKKGGHGVEKNSDRGLFYQGIADYYESPSDGKKYQHAANYILQALASDSLEDHQITQARALLAAIYPV